MYGRVGHNGDALVVVPDGECRPFDDAVVGAVCIDVDVQTGPAQEQREPQAREPLR
jgi:hypothetical protein